jgi:hypothetical protein
MNGTLITITNTVSKAFGFHFEWAGGDSLTVRVVDDLSGHDFDVFTMMGPEAVPFTAIESACWRYSERIANEWDAANA